MNLPKTDYDFGHFRMQISPHVGKKLNEIPVSDLIDALNIVKDCQSDHSGPSTEVFIAMVSKYLEQIARPEKIEDDIPF